MADGVTLSTGEVIATKDIGGVEWPRGITGYLNSGGTAVVDVSPANPLPVTSIPSSPVATAYLPVRLTDGTSFIGAGTDYSEGDSSATLKGTVLFWEDASDIVRPVSAAKPLPVSGAFYQATQPVSLSSVPSHAVTNAGTFAVQASQSGTWTVTGAGGSFPVTDSGGSLTVDAPVATPVFVRLSDGTSAIATLPVSLASLPALATGANTIGSIANTSFTVTQATGTNLHTVVDSGTITTVTTVTGVTTVSTVTNLSQLGGVAIAMGTGARSTGTQRVTIATDDIVPVSQSGTWNVGTVTTVTAVTAITNALPAGTNTIGNVGTLPMTTGGLSSYSFLSTAAVQAASVKSSAGQVYSLQFFNTNAAARFVRLYNQSTSPATTDGANILWRGFVPGNTAGTGFVVQFPNGLAFSSGIGIRVSASVADNDATVLAANEIAGNLSYK